MNTYELRTHSATGLQFVVDTSVAAPATGLAKNVVARQWSDGRWAATSGTPKRVARAAVESVGVEGAVFA